mmetsp:Transcript_10164/g.19709  ORF Transcript_10164/g.19709 Transcript_10164/m.19709 type:complete len:216 (-) Transcript_10164:1139-1786(-)
MPVWPRTCTLCHRQHLFRYYWRAVNSHFDVSMTVTRKWEMHEEKKKKERRPARICGNLSAKVKHRKGNRARIHPESVSTCAALQLPCPYCFDPSPRSWLALYIPPDQQRIGSHCRRRESHREIEGTILGLPREREQLPGGTKIAPPHSSPDRGLGEVMCRRPALACPLHHIGDLSCIVVQFHQENRGVSVCSKVVSLRVHPDAELEPLEGERSAL